jgi:hypothetical protein
MIRISSGYRITYWTLSLRKGLRSGQDNRGHFGDAMNQPQLTFPFKPPEAAGQELRDKGMKQALSHAESVNHDWQEKALVFLFDYIHHHPSLNFSCEMVREEAKGVVPKPPSLRAWGPIFPLAARKGWIIQVGYVHVKNPDAHMANAALWESRLVE